MRPCPAELGRSARAATRRRPTRCTGRSSGNCGQCHTPKAWKPATFEHDKFFVLDKDHNATCVTCHTGNDYKRYTCYGCHEHTPANVRAKHREGRHPDFENCVECHRSADEEPAKRGARGERKRERD